MFVSGTAIRIDRQLVPVIDTDGLAVVVDYGEVDGREFCAIAALIFLHFACSIDQALAQLVHAERRIVFAPYLDLERAALVLRRRMLAAALFISCGHISIVRWRGSVAVGISNAASPFAMRQQARAACLRQRWSSRARDGLYVSAAARAHLHAAQRADLAHRAAAGLACVIGAAIVRAPDFRLTGILAAGTMDEAAVAAARAAPGGE